MTTSKKSSRKMQRITKKRTGKPQTTASDNANALPVPFDPGFHSFRSVDELAQFLKPRLTRNLPPEKIYFQTITNDIPPYWADAMWTIARSFSQRQTRKFCDFYTPFNSIDRLPSQILGYCSKYGIMISGLWSITNAIGFESHDFSDEFYEALRQYENSGGLIKPAPYEKSKYGADIFGRAKMVITARPNNQSLITVESNEYEWPNNVEATWKLILPRLIADSGLSVTATGVYDAVTSMPIPTPGDTGVPIPPPGLRLSEQDQKDRKVIWEMWSRKETDRAIGKRISKSEETVKRKRKEWFTPPLRSSSRKKRGAESPN